MAILASPSELFSQYPQEQTPAISSFALSSLEWVAQELAAYLYTDFEYSQKTDVFYDSGVFQTIRLRLSKGFLTGTPTLRYSTSLDELSVSPEVPVGKFSVDLERGLVTILREPPTLANPSYGYYQVTYNAGFQVIPDPEMSGAELYEDPPKWLKELSMLWAYSLVKEHYDPEGFSKSLMQRVKDTLARKTRVLPQALRPLL